MRWRLGNWGASPQALLRERVSGTGFQIALEREGGGFVVERHIAFQAPANTCGGRISSFVVVGDSLAQVLGEADVAAGGRCD